MLSGIFLQAQALRKSSKLLRFVLLFLMVFPTTGIALSNCVLFNYVQEETYFKDGDFLLGAVIQLHFLKNTFIPDFSESPNRRYDLEIELQNYRHYLAFIYGIEEINANNNILPNISLGYNIYESLGLEGFAQNAVLKILTGTNDLVPNYSCSKTGVIAAFIGDQSSLTSLSMARVIDLYSYTQISYGAMDPIFDDRLQFPFFYRTVPSQYFQHDAIIRILQHFDWTWVGIISSDDDNSQRGSQELKEQIINSGGCVDYLETVGNYITDTIEIFLKVSDVIKDSTANVIILYSLAQNFNSFLIQSSIEEHLAVVWIISCTWSYPTELGNFTPLLIFNGSLVLSIGKGNIPGLKEFMYSASPQKYPEDYRLKRTWCRNFRCDSPNDPNDTDPYHLGYGYPPCTGSETLQDLPLKEYDVQNFKITYSIYTAVYALAHALHAMLSDQSVRVKDKLSGNREYEQWKLQHYLKNIHFSTSSGEIFFDENGGRPGYYDIVNWILLQNFSESKEIIGNYKTSVLEEDEFYINASAFRWNHMFTKFPRSTCSDTCEPGYRKSPRESKPSCCYDCVLCPEGEISNTTDMESCIPCPEDQWPNDRRDTCIPRIVEFLSYEESLGVTLLITAVFLSVLTAAVLGLFLLYRDTPVVRANNRDLSYLLLLSLMFSFLCTLLFIGSCGQITCQLRQSAFGFFFVVAVSSVLAKTITVIIAFKATKPGSKFRKWLGKKVSICLVIVCSSIQVIACTTWLVHAPPYPEYDTQSITGKMILQCNEGSAMAFYIVIGYMGCLAVMSFLVAFLARKIPNDYNETQLITFSMLVFCSVWISFIPAYVSSRGKYTVAVEVFAILASSGGLLGCIFFPKCYIILLRPDLNTRGHLTSKHSH